MGCKGYLTEINPNETTKADFYQNLEDSEAGLTAVYGSMMNHYIWNLGEEACRADMGYPGMDRPTPTSRYLAFYQHTYTETTNEVNKKWDALYSGIFRANQVIHGLQSEAMEDFQDDPKWVLQMAQARFFRGLYHFYLHQAFNKGAIIVRDTWTDANDMYKKVSPADSVINFVRDDFRFAYENLPNIYNNSTGYVSEGRISRGTASMLLGNSYMFDFVNGINYDSAAFYYEDVMNGGYGYALEDDMSKIFTNSGDFNKESILEIGYSNEVRPDLGDWDETNGQNRFAAIFSPQFYGGQRQTIPVGWIAYAYMHKDPVDMSDPRNQVELDGQTYDRLVSLRATAMMAVPQDDLTPYYKVESVAEADPFRNGGSRAPEFAFFKQFSNYDIVDTERSLPLGLQRSPKNMVVNRYSEAILNLAECRIQQGRLQDAINLINQIRERWGVVLLGTDQGTGRTYDGVAYTTTSLMEHLMYNEKPLELSVEGHMKRWIDLRRWNVIRENYERISSQNYWVIHYKGARTYSKKILWNTEIIEGGDTHPFPEKEFTARPNYKIVDGELALLNYVPSLHDFYPIPTSETSTNPEVNN
ncbi:hypothetical protein NH26_19870 [Flammeovirga pacifica]|uniref:RagB/SusD family nutrient uptake outer membrane protein n=2 Tax=Flammeovirga pacifica TaxID=915059 RepID=A0A1S1YS66_FLAPC|nr:hypothetical protein NH26_19870 [Flammeovirga pacifica]